MRLSLRTMVLGVFVLLVVSLCLQAVLSIATTVRSAQQVTALERRGLVPAVGLAILSRDLAQEQGLLTTDMARLPPERRGAVYDELTTLDASITSLARRDLLPVAL